MRAHQWKSSARDERNSVWWAMQSGGEPACLRLSDADEAGSTLAMRATPRGRAALVERAGRFYLERRGVSLETGSILILGFEGDPASVEHERATAKKVLGRHGAVSLGRSAGTYLYPDF